MNNLEAAARQLIQLVTAFYGVIFGIISLGSSEVAAALTQRSVTLWGALSILTLLVALIASLVVIAPLPSQYRPNSPSDRREAWERMVARKANSLLIATCAFGIGLVTFVGLIATLLYAR